eukprot:CAMPEP_0194147768 /NCGR_PEP_ID=MMETSP0152-20130528/27701_1 /TAXON_ID=1049557 /ORGANISM="Thalassiothrix antarctica, Strain L6-D1" /LENGTH=72 /DNA_ID=CAMNT_0038848823 /DNA_START=182 /DNA_END=400 /DNA_ORIENTATION=-
MDIATTTFPSKQATFTNLYALKKNKKKSVKESSKKGKVDYGEIALMFVNPLNPYSWFFYFFVGIYVNAAINP